MAISYIAVGALSQAAASITPAFPAGATTGRLAVLQVVSGHPDDAIPSTPSGWGLVESVSGGGGTFGSGTGPRRHTWFTRVLNGTDSAPTTVLPTGTGSVIAGRIHVLSRSAGAGWRWASSSGEDTSSGTGFSTAAASALTWAVGDFALIGYALPVGTASLTAEAITATGVTYGTVTEQADDQITSGNAARLAAATVSVTAGPGTQAPTLAATAAVATTGVAGVLRLREASANVAALPQTVFPPRNLVSATGLLADDIVTASLYRQIGSSLTPVRAASSVDVTGQDAFLRIDAEQPYGVAHEYLAVLTDVNGLQWQVYSSTLTSTVTADVISDAIRGVGAHVTITSWPDKKREREAATFNVGGRLVVVSKPRSGATATVLVRTDTTEAGDALQDVLDEATEGVIQIRKQTTMEGVDGYLVPLSDSEDRNWYDPVRRWALDVVETEEWPTVLEARGFTLQTLADNYTSLQDLANDFTPGTLLDIALHDFGA